MQERLKCIFFSYKTGLITVINASCQCPKPGLDIVATAPYSEPSSAQCLQLPSKADQFAVILNMTVKTECVDFVKDKRVKYLSCISEFTILTTLIEVYFELEIFFLNRSIRQITQNQWYMK